MTSTSGLQKVKCKMYLEIVNQIIEKWCYTIMMYALIGDKCELLVINKVIGTGSIPGTGVKRASTLYSR